MEGIHMSDFFIPYEGDEPFVFVSYAHKDTNMVLPLIRGLHDRGVRVWYDGGVEVGNEWPDYIAEHMEKSYCVLAFVSRNFGDSNNCRQEINFAIDEGKDPVVIYLEPRNLLKAGLRMRLGAMHALYFERYPTINDLLDVLVRAEIVKPCIGTAKREVPAKPKPIPFDTIEFADEGKTVPAKTVEETPEACYARADSLHREKRYEEAVQWYRKAAMQGHAAAQRGLGFCYQNGLGIRQDYAEAVKWYRKAAQQGYATAENDLGYCYGKGIGVQRDDVEAAKWYRRAAEQGNMYAQRNLGIFYQNGTGVKQDAAQAAEWYRKAAEQGYAAAQRSLGFCFQNGFGVRKNPDEAVKWYRKAAEQGNVDAENDMGYCYGNGIGVTRDYGEAVKWYRRAAERGHMYAQRNMGLYFQNGTGVKQDKAEAVKWYRMAAEQGYTVAQNDLGFCYHKGIGVPQDNTEAVRWYRKAAAQMSTER